MAAEGVLILARWVHFATAMLLFGASLFPYYAVTQCTNRARVGLKWGTLIMAAVLALAFMLVWGACIVVQLADGLTLPGLADVAEGVFGDTDFGRVLLVRFALALVVLGAALVSNRTAWVLGPATLLLASQAWIGHATMGQGWWRLAAQSAHLLAAGAWLGGLLPLSVMVRRAWRSGDTDAVTLASTALRRFSDVGVVAVAILISTGMLNTSLLVGSLAGLLSPYGRVLIVKVALVLVMVLVAAVNRLRLMPRLASEPSASGPNLRQLSRNILLEQLLGLLVLAAVSVLGIMNPGATS